MQAIGADPEAPQAPRSFIAVALKFNLPHANLRLGLKIPSKLIAVVFGSSGQHAANKLELKRFLQGAVGISTRGQTLTRQTFKRKEFVHMDACLRHDLVEFSESFVRVAS
jgi:hypothetical protein